ncbi:hypothetical protein B0P06_004636 [Clostridium saccharoperbutylacetonicum]|uniref:Uncharacterized protein n=1 Tax=Clostridium saccharoperbutylacetonicum N1-4(HMT) TaxID=931276 RepID=M1MQP6_9CLOT|nr:hypothetical protein [Clostridium saccharoperbutylacetonicum]AGF57076.1 hypothetical protein Cspa_c33150 [Clostridium saccharoperbutylacetonicum N1-4(HMT)]NRT62165.1 hypothetical protein [Clostridium saccharoperbutylacetonicum]NSB25496.1 hypothetical protein [Clostridium saccharoperbutylacetonicum]NSB44865.1 hypothetical protein [Clostridium saccharoperbutylacetonicum]
MFFYILNLLNDALKKNKIDNLPAFEVIDDTTNIAKLAGIKRNFDFKCFNDKIITIFRLFSKYKLTLTDSIDILDKLIINEKNSWILKNIYGDVYIYEKEKSRLDLIFLINHILNRYKIMEMEVSLTGLAL